MLSYIILRSTAAFGGAPFRLNKCTALGSAGSGAAVGGASGGLPGALVGGALGVASSLNQDDHPYQNSQSYRQAVDK